MFVHRPEDVKTPEQAVKKVEEGQLPMLEVSQPKAETEQSEPKKRGRQRKEN